ncbi:MAG: AI-2E family transporter [Candidatus Paceibacteria bacterium]
MSTLYREHQMNLPSYQPLTERHLVIMVATTVLYSTYMTTKIHFFDALKLAGAFVAAYVVLQLVVTLKAVFLMFFTAIIIAIAMDQAIMRLQKRGIGRIPAAVVLYVLFALGIVFAVVSIVPPLASELRNVVVDYSAEELIAPEEVARFDIMPYIQALSVAVSDSPNAVFSTVIKTAGSLTTFLVVFFVAFFLTVQKGGVRSFVIPFIPPLYQLRAGQFWDKLQERVGYWLWGKTLSSLVVGAVTFLGLWTLGIPYALSLALVALILNYIPFVGPIIAAVPAVFLGFNISLVVAIIVVMLYTIINAIIEPFLLGPLFMRKAIEINPAFLILSVISGGYLGGVLGIIISIPVAAILYLAATEYWAQTKGVEMHD